MSTKSFSPSLSPADSKLVGSASSTAKRSTVASVGIEDVQGSIDTRNIAINQVGIKGIKHPIAFSDRSGVQHTVAEFNMFVSLSPEFKGTHMSRFVDILNSQTNAISIESFKMLLVQMGEKLEAESGRVEVTFPWFVTKTAPVSGVKSTIDYQVTLTGEVHEEAASVTIGVLVPVTSLCPCSKKISEYGAHNQRSHVIMNVKANDSIYVEELIDIAEAQASAELYGMLKRVDEKYITERAYDNPKFVEDMVRDVAACLNQDERVVEYRVSVENFESIHNHSAYAEITHTK